eukprot:3213937-Rhodomonas_salina.2
MVSSACVVQMTLKFSTQHVLSASSFVNTRSPRGVTVRAARDELCLCPCKHFSIGCWSSSLSSCTCER